LSTDRGLGRRRFLQLGIAVCAFAPAPALCATVKHGRRTLAFHDTHTGENLRATYWADGAYLPDELAAIDHQLRDFRTGAVAPIERGLLDILHMLAQRLDTKAPFHVISGYRSPATNAMLAAASNGVAKRSLHTKGMAIDVRLPNRRLKDVRQAAIDLRQGGVGFYPASGFVHVDVGRVRYW